VAQTQGRGSEICSIHLRCLFCYTGEGQLERVKVAGSDHGLTDMGRGATQLVLAPCHGGMQLSIRDVYGR